MFQMKRNEYNNFCEKTKLSYLSNKVVEYQGKQKKLYSLIKKFRSGNKNIPYPEKQDNTLANNYGVYFHEEVETIVRKINCLLEEANIELPIKYKKL